MDILEDQGVTTLWCGLGPEFGSDLVPMQRCFSSDGPVKLIHRVCLMVLLCSYLRRMLAPFHGKFENLFRWMSRWSLGWNWFRIKDVCRCFKSFWLMFCYRSVGQVKLFRRYYCTGVTGYAGTKDVSCWKKTCWNFGRTIIGNYISIFSWRHPLQACSGGLQVGVRGTFPARNGYVFRLVWSLSWILRWRWFCRWYFLVRFSDALWWH